MSLISLSKVSFRYNTNVLLDEVDLSIAEGDMIALVGRNGSGKSSLLKIIAGVNEADAGLVEKKRGIKAAYLPQDVPVFERSSVYSFVAKALGADGELLARYHELQKKLDSDYSDELQGEFDELLDRINHIEDAWNLEKKVSKTLEELELDADLEVSTASAGLKRRILLAKQLVDRPDILMLDEPTNHLDIDSVIWLENFLKNSKITLVFVSHDRKFLENLATRVVEIDRAKLISFNCGFSDFIDKRDDYLRALEQQDAIFDKKLAIEEAWIRQGIKARRTRNEGRVKELMKLRNIRQQRRTKVGSVSIQVQDTMLSGQKMMSLEDISFSYGDKAIFKNFSTTIYRGDKIGIIGKNGVGKTTLLNAILGKLKPTTGSVEYGTNLQISYFDQLREELNPRMTLFNFVGEGTDFVTINGNKQNVVSYLQKFLFSPEQAHGEIAMLSGGERNRLLLAKMFTKKANLLVLDEPTNDLDMETMDTLQDCLMNFDGSILLVSHDRYFLNNIVTGVFCFEDDSSIKELVGGYDEYFRYKELSKKPALEQLSPKPEKKKFTPQKKEKFTNKERWELEAIQPRIDEIEAKLEELSSKLQDTNFLREHPEQIEAVQAEIQALEAEDEKLFERWAYLEERQKLLEG
ncbi:MAG: ATP-binding cassette domain-containing protein [Opitutales bacterium]